MVVQWNDNENCFRNHATGIAPVNQLLCSTMLLEVHLAAGDFTGSKITTHRIVHGVIAAIAKLQPPPFKFPNTADDDIKATQLGFYNIAHFPLVLRAMDCTCKNSITRWTCYNHTHLDQFPEQGLSTVQETMTS